MLKKNAINFIVRIVAVGLLIWALDKHLYSYYTALRWIVCAVAVYLMYIASINGQREWIWIIGIIAILFNPIMPVHLDRQIWGVIDCLAAFILLVSIFFVRFRSDGSSKSDDRGRPREQDPRPI